MTQIEIKELPSYKTQDGPISVNIDGLCNHADTYIEEDTVYRPTQEQIDNNTDQDEVVRFETCTKCKSYRDVTNEYLMGDWEGIQVMPL